MSRALASALLGVCALGAAACGSSRALPCKDLPGRHVRLIEDHRHIPYVSAHHTPYDSVPPTSGPHIAFTTATGVYGDPIPDEVQVHALEHGHVLIQYASGTDHDEVRALEHFARAFPHDVIVAPYPKLRRGIALTAWGRIELLQQADARRVRAFVRALAGRYVHGWRGGATPCGP